MFDSVFEQAVITIGLSEPFLEGSLFQPIRSAFLFDCDERLSCGSQIRAFVLN